MSKTLPTGPSPSSKNSVFINTGCPVISGIPILPVRDTSKRQQTPAFDIVDEAIYHFRTNIFMRDFKIKNDADRLLHYLTFYAMKCLKFFDKNPNDKQKCATEIQSWNMKDFPIPGDGGFIISQLVTAPKNNQEKAELKSFFKLIRTETGNRLLEIIFKDGKADKWWVCFAQRKFLEKEMQN